jgi:hypothetical protein
MIVAKKLKALHLVWLNLLTLDKQISEHISMNYLSLQNFSIILDNVNLRRLSGIWLFL